MRLVFDAEELKISCVRPCKVTRNVYKSLVYSSALCNNIFLQT